MLIEHLPLESATIRAIDPDLARDAKWGWSEHLLDDVRQAIQLLGTIQTKNPKAAAAKVKAHPSRPSGRPKRKAADPARRRRVAAAQARQRERQAAIDRGDIT